MNSEQRIQICWIRVPAMLLCGAAGLAAACLLSWLPPAFSCAAAIWYFVGSLAAGCSMDLYSLAGFFAGFAGGASLWSLPWYAAGLAWPGSGLLVSWLCTLVMSLLCLSGCGYTARASAFRWGLVVCMLVILLYSQHHLPWSGLFLLAAGFQMQAGRALLRRMKETGRSQALPKM